MYQNPLDNVNQVWNRIGQAIIKGDILTRFSHDSLRCIVFDRRFALLHLRILLIAAWFAPTKEDRQHGEKYDYGYSVHLRLHIASANCTRLDGEM